MIVFYSSLKILLINLAKSFYETISFFGRETTFIIDTESIYIIKFFVKHDFCFDGFFFNFLQETFLLNLTATPKFNMLYNDNEVGADDIKEFVCQILSQSD